MIMKIIFPLLVAMLLAACGCQSPPAAPPPGSSIVLTTRNNCYSLLHQLLSEEKDVSKLRFIMWKRPEVKELIRKISAASEAGAKTLEGFAKRDPSIILDDIALPSGEVKTRAAISSTKEKEILGQTGDKFELTLLLTQTEALSYGWHLAKVASENEPQPERARALAGLSEEMQNLYHEAFMLLLSKTKS